MDIQYQPEDSAMQRFIRPGDAFRVYLTSRHVEPLSLSGDDVIKIISLHFLQAEGTLRMADRLSAIPDYSPPPKKRLMGQHKALRGRP